MQYWDTSALLKLFVPEADSTMFTTHVTSAVYISQLGQAEMLRAIARKEMEGAIPSNSAEMVFGKFLADISAGRIIVLPFDSNTETEFRKLVLGLHRRKPSVVLRTLDAIHLSTARLLPADEVVTLDRHLRTGAMALGLKLFP